MKKKGLREKLFDLIMEVGYLSYGDMCQFVANEGYKVSTAERELRHLMAETIPYIKSEMKVSKRGSTYINAYLKTDATPPKPKERVVEHYIAENGEKITRITYR